MIVHLYKTYKQPPFQRFIYTDFTGDFPPITSLSYLSLQLGALLSMQAHTEPQFPLHWKALFTCSLLCVCVRVMCVWVCACVCVCHLVCNRVLSSWWASSVLWACSAGYFCTPPPPSCLCLPHTQLVSANNRSGKESMRWSTADKGRQEVENKGEKRQEPGARRL